MSDPDKSDAAEPPPLKPANENPWYCLATLHGEQSEAGGIDHELANKNRLSWGEWVGSGQAEHSRFAGIAELFANRAPSLTLPEHGSNPDFSYTRFARKVSFANFWFPKPANFGRAEFAGIIDFEGANCTAKVDFGAARFLDAARFSEAHLNGANFQNAIFYEYAFFDRMNFFHPEFARTDFRSFVDFYSTEFSDQSWFMYTKFGELAKFNGAKFKGTADFYSAEFASGSQFKSTIFSDAAYFYRATFRGPVLFENAEFEARTVFAGARFERHVPDFRGAEMHEATEWHGVVWPAPPKEDAQEQVYAYERLKLEMERLKKHDDEQMFFRKELRARRGLVRVLSGVGRGFAILVRPGDTQPVSHEIARCLR
jgi:uncharacterized protein YjbI with pentapeptide repeats